jgi:predicted TIM-barrel fold metal-dependent hydrolase
MLVDINTYIGHWPFRQPKYNTCDARVERMNRFGVDMAVVSSLNGIFYKNPHSANEELYDEIRSCKNFQDRLIPFAVINPIYGAWKSHFNVSTEQLGMRGIRLYPQYHGYPLTDPACIELVKRARDRNLPVALSLRMVDSRPSSWMDLDSKGEWALRDVVPLVEEVPDAKFLILNVANSMQLSPEETALLRSANVLMDTSGRNIIQLGKLIQLYGEEKFAFGSHAPILDDLTGLLRIESLRENEADESVKTRLRSGNAKAMLAI